MKVENILISLFGEKITLFLKSYSKGVKNIFSRILGVILFLIWIFIPFCFCYRIGMLDGFLSSESLSLSAVSLFVYVLISVLYILFTIFILELFENSERDLEYISKMNSRKDLPISGCYIKETK